MAIWRDKMRAKKVFGQLLLTKREARLVEAVVYFEMKQDGLTAASKESQYYLFQRNEFIKVVCLWVGYFAFLAVLMGVVAWLVA